MPTRIYYAPPRLEPYIFQPAIAVALIVLAAAVLLRAENWPEGHLLVKKRPRQNWFLFVETIADTAHHEAVRPPERGAGVHPACAAGEAPAALLPAADPPGGLRGILMNRGKAVGRAL